MWLLFAVLAFGGAARLLASAPTIQSQKAANPRCGVFDDFLRRVAAAASPAAKSNLVDEYLACVKGTDAPLMEKGTKDGFGRAIFLYRGAASLVALAGDMNGWTPNEAFTQVSGTNLYYIAREYELDARLDYKFVLNDKNWIFDPLNSRRIAENLGPSSYFTMPDYSVPPELEPGPSLLHGAIEEISISSRILNIERAAKVYLPPTYGGSRERFKTLYILDGMDYLEYGKINRILDAMIQRNEIPPIIAVLLPTFGRHDDAANAEIARSIATEIVPAIDAKYHTKADAASRAVVANSLGGLTSLMLAGQYPQVFANCAAQSSLISADADLDKLVTTGKGAVRIHIDVGTYESNVSRLDVLAGNRRLRDFLQGRGFALQYREVHEGHSWGNWPARVPEALRYFWALPSKKR